MVTEEEDELDEATTFGGRPVQVQVTSPDRLSASDGEQVIGWPPALGISATMSRTNGSRPVRVTLLVPVSRSTCCWKNTFSRLLGENGKAARL